MVPEFVIQLIGLDLWVKVNFDIYEKCRDSKIYLNNGNPLIEISAHEGARHAERGNNGKILLVKFIIEEYLKRELNSNEMVFNKDKNKLDCRRENLMLCCYNKNKK